MNEERYQELYKFLLEKSMSAEVEPVFKTDDGQEIYLDEKATFVLNNILEQAFIPYLAQILVDEGYHKDL